MPLDRKAAGWDRFLQDLGLIPTERPTQLKKKDPKTSGGFAILSLFSAAFLSFLPVFCTIVLSVHVGQVQDQQTIASLQPALASTSVGREGASGALDPLAAPNAYHLGTLAKFCDNA